MSEQVVVAESDLAQCAEGIREPLRLALAAVALGATVEVSVCYSKQTKAPPRRPGADFVELPGVSSDVYFGALTGAFRTKTGALRVRMLSGTRSHAGEHGWLTMIPEGITSLVVTRVVPPEVPPA